VFDAPVHSKRQVKRTTVTIDGHVVKKTNNYENNASHTVMGDNDEIEIENRAEEQRRAKKREAKRRAKERKRAENPESYAPKPQTAEQIHAKQYNQEIRDAEDRARSLRQYYFKAHLGDLRRFLDAKTVARLQALPASPPDPPPPFKELAMQPEGLSEECEMRDYQLIGLNFLAEKLHSGVPAIIGDEMGLGKTLQTISYVQERSRAPSVTASDSCAAGTKVLQATASRLPPVRPPPLTHSGSRRYILHVKNNLNLKGPTLILCPLSVLSSWMNEFKRWAPGLKVVRFHASSVEERDRQRAAIKSGIVGVDAIVTTYVRATPP
jgi:SWI/SNF-related matrix-associated actin-dependent regulator of chromatin subfamily A member 5